ncbi:MAG: hypothetical protein JST86_01855 [Bacteroidetes bacterium]|nr:hypothetical protein [Bacteroidota bacterium]
MRSFLQKVFKPDLDNAEFVSTIKTEAEKYKEPAPWLIGMKNSMLNLLYPAFLGAMLYGVLAYCPDIISEFKQYLNFWNGSPQNKVRMLGMFAIIAFFVCDYLHLYVVRKYSGWHFLIHLITAVGMLWIALAFLPDGAGGDYTGSGKEDILNRYERLTIVFLVISLIYVIYDAGVLFKKKVTKNVEAPLYWAYSVTNGVMFLTFVIVCLLSIDITTKTFIQLGALLVCSTSYFILVSQKHKIESKKAAIRKEAKKKNPANELSDEQVEKINKISDLEETLNALSKSASGNNQTLKNLDSQIEELKKVLKQIKLKLAID